MRTFLSCLLVAGFCRIATADEKDDIAKGNVRNFSIATEFYKKKHGKYPEKLQDLLDIGYIEPGSSLLDPWGVQYQYDPKGKKNAGKKADIWAKNPDGIEIGNWPPPEKDPKK
jgi:hypothetical protein